MIANITYSILTVIFLIALIAIPVALPIAAFCMWRRKNHARAMLFTAATLLVWACYFPFLPFGDKRVAELRTPDGWDFAVHQICNFDAEPYTTRFYYRTSQTNRWHTFYMDHEDTRWWSGRIAYDDETRQVQIYRGGKVVAQFATSPLEFTSNGFTTTNSWVLDENSTPSDEVRR